MESSQKPVACAAAEKFIEFASRLGLQYIDLGTDEQQGVSGRLLTNGKISIVVDIKGPVVCVIGTYVIPGEPA